MKPVRIDDFARHRYVNSVRVTPDGSRLVYSVIGVDLPGNCYTNDLWSLDLAGGEARRLTSSGKEGSFDFLPDGSLVFASRRRSGASDAAPAPALRAGATQAEVVAAVCERSADVLAQDEARGTDLFHLALDGGEATLYAHVPLTVADWRALPDGRLVVRARELADAAAPYATAEDIPVWENGDTYTAGLRWGLYLVDPAEADAPRRLTEPGETVDAWDLAPDGSRVFVAGSVYERAMPLKNRMRSIEVATGAVRDLGPEGLCIRNFRPLDGNTLALVVSDLELHGINTDSQIYLMGVDGENFRRITPADFDEDLLFAGLTTDARQGGGQTLCAAGGDLFFLNNHADVSRLCRITAEGSVAAVVDGAGSVDSFDTLDGRTLYYVAMRPGRLPELYTRTVDEAGATVVPETALTNMSADLADAAVELPESFAFMSNGDELTGYVVKPVGYEPGKKYPGILWVHGGPKCDMGNVFSHEIAYLSGLGYFVFYTNPHGAGGHGQKFAASIFGGLGQMDFQDLMTFTDQVLERYPDIDAEHLAEMGGSYGGFMTNWIIGHTDRFCCCNSQRSIGNWVSMFGVSDIGYYFADDQTCGWPWGNVEAMWDQSPLKYADRAKTPTLFLHADCDYRCPLEQGLQMYTALKVHDVPARLVVFKGENHELSRSGKPQARVRRLAEIANWYGVWLKGDPEGEPSLRG